MLFYSLEFYNDLSRLIIQYCPKEYDTIVKKEKTKFKLWATPNIPNMMNPTINLDLKTDNLKSEQNLFKLISSF